MVKEMEISDNENNKKQSTCYCAYTGCDPPNNFWIFRYLYSQLAYHLSTRRSQNTLISAHFCLAAAGLPGLPVYTPLRSHTIVLCERISVTQIVSPHTPLYHPDS